jgi:ferredoxin
LNSAGFKNRISRREFLKGIRSKKDGLPILDKEKCTGCGLCAIDCPTRALTMVRFSQEGLYQLVFRHDLCHYCGICEKSCPEQCLQFEKDLEPGRVRKGVTVVFEDRIFRCSECGTPLFPQAMISRLKSRMRVATESAWLFDLCPSCRIKAQFEKKRIRKSRI